MHPGRPDNLTADGNCKCMVPDMIEADIDIVRWAASMAVYTHNLDDKHDTHVAVALKVIEAIRDLPAAE